MSGIPVAGRLLCKISRAGRRIWFVGKTNIRVGSRVRARYLGIFFDGVFDFLHDSPVLVAVITDQARLVIPLKPGFDCQVLR